MPPSAPRVGSRSRCSLLAVTAGLVALVGSVLAPLAPSAASERPLVLDHGHIDAFNVMLDDSGSPVLTLKEDVTGSHVSHAPEDVSLRVKEAALTSLPDIPNVPAQVRGTDVYYLPLSQDANLVWPGWDSQSLAGTGYDQVDIEIQDVTGPGEVYVWSSGAFGGLTSLLTDGGYALPNTIHQSYLAHVHANWAFTQAGEYHFTVQAFAINSTTGERIPTNTGEYHWIVGDVPEPAPTMLTIEGLANPYEPGAAVSLRAVPDVEAEGAAHGWETLGADGTWLQIEGQDTATLAGIAASDGQQVRAWLRLGEATLTSEPVTIEVNAAPQLPRALIIDGLEASYVQGADVRLEAKPDILVEGATYRWETSVDGETWTTSPATTGSVHTGIAQSDGQRLRVTIIIGGADVVTSAPVVLVVEAAAPVLPTSVSLEGLANPYAPGTSVTLTAVPDIPADGLVHQWSTSADGVTWHTIEADAGPVLTIPASDGQWVRVAIRFAGDELAVATPVTVRTLEEPITAPTRLTIGGLADSYVAGAAVALTAEPDVVVPGASYRWESSLDGTAWRAVTGQTTNSYSSTAEADGERIRAVLVLDGADVVTSQPVTIVLRSDSPGLCWALDLDHGHVDAFNVALIGGDPVLTLKEDVTGSHVQHAPEEVNLVVKAAALETLPDVASVPEGLRGVPAYYLPLNQDPNLLWPGWDSQGLAGSGFDQVDIRILEVHGPGEVYLWSTGSFGELDSLLVGDGYTLPGTIHQSYLAHVHANWAFTQPGTYHVTVEATAINSTTGARVTTNTGDYLFSVGDFVAAPGDHACPSDGPAVPTLAPAAPAEDELTDATRGGVTVSPAEVDAGEQVTVEVGDAVAGDFAAAFIFSEPHLLNPTVDGGWNRTNATGAFQVSIPRDTAPGDHRVAVVDRDSELVGWADVLVTEAADPDPTPPPGTTPPRGVTPPGGSAPGGTNPGGTPQLCRPVAASATPTSGTGANPSVNGAAATPTGEVVVGAEGHFDFGPAILDGWFTVLVKDDRTAPPVWRDPATVVFDLGDAALRSAEEIPDELSFIAPAGQDVYMIQQIQESGVPWLGWNTQHETVVNGPGARGVEMTLDDVEGPGELAVFLNGNFGQLVGHRVVDTVGGPTSYTIPGNTHQHGNWVFTEAGVYAVTITISADGESATSTLQFSVGQSDPAAAATGTTSATTGTQATAGSGVTADGEPCVLASTGADTEMGLLALAGALVMLAGGVLVRASRRRSYVGR
ncbi:LPXTG cell wall anchor domain-containing protein [Occultella glacieicola]|uniref:LPXTG cell wall anchor domain-containing protein n=1 Tax=Occultella glacieicola TaxID=2518684 RepID=A0ABY2DXD5_9MICO|nr:TIGR03773 family transporter-associated surface protein [Occultella glacieicola]TDE88780.1 LPXTG cell wall anchor domain-containing protein [Occultella glacieicola]